VREREKRENVEREGFERERERERTMELICDKLVENH
jgi:hypothetical protein